MSAVTCTSSSPSRNLGKDGARSRTSYKDAATPLFGAEKKGTSRIGGHDVTLVVRWSREKRTYVIIYHVITHVILLDT